LKNYRIIKKKDAKSVELGTKMIRKYTSMNRDLEVNHMKISGRHPANKNHFLYETACHLMLFILSGSGHFICEQEEFILRKGDVLEILPKTKFAI
jgi:mannose-6-phosphate isomerase-like protein (cupin superfamily)